MRHNAASATRGADVLIHRSSHRPFRQDESAAGAPRTLLPRHGVLIIETTSGLGPWAVQSRLTSQDLEVVLAAASDSALELRPLPQRREQDVRSAFR